jgi:hypothetical protein
MEIIYTGQTDLGDKRSTGVCIAEPACCISTTSLNISHPAGALADNISPKRRRVSNGIALRFQNELVCCLISR